MNIRRYYFPGQVVFITQIVKDRNPVFSNPEMVNLFKEILKNVKKYHPYKMLAYVILPDHFHILIIPSDQSDFSKIMHSMKLNFTKTYKDRTNFIGSLNFWQKRFWDHVIRDETDLENHIHYIHHNPVKHGYARKWKGWPFSSAIAYLETVGCAAATRHWRDYDISSMGESWDP